MWQRPEHLPAAPIFNRTSLQVSSHLLLLLSKLWQKLFTDKSYGITSSRLQFYPPLLFAFGSQWKDHAFWRHTTFLVFGRMQISPGAMLPYSTACMRTKETFAYWRSIGISYLSDPPTGQCLRLLASRCQSSSEAQRIVGRLQFACPKTNRLRKKTFQTPKGGLLSFNTRLLQSFAARWNILRSGDSLW